MVECLDSCLWVFCHDLLSAMLRAVHQDLIFMCRVTLTLRLLHLYCFEWIVCVAE